MQKAYRRLIPSLVHPGLNEIQACQKCKCKAPKTLLKMFWSWKGERERDNRWVLGITSTQAAMQSNSFFSFVWWRSVRVWVYGCTAKSSPPPPPRPVFPHPLAYLTSDLMNWMPMREETLIGDGNTTFHKYSTETFIRNLFKSHINW